MGGISELSEKIKELKIFLNFKSTKIVINNARYI